MITCFIYIIPIPFYFGYCQNPITYTISKYPIINSYFYLLLSRNIIFQHIIVAAIGLLILILTILLYESISYVVLIIN